MRFVTTRALREADSTPAHAVGLPEAILDGLGPDGGLYVPETIARWSAAAIAALPSQSLTDIGVATLAPYVRDEVADADLRTLVADALNFPMPLVEIEPATWALELFHGPTLAFKDVAARVMARLVSAFHGGGAPVTILVATSGDTGSAVGYAFHRVPHTQVVILYPHGRISPTQESQLVAFNGEPGSNVAAYAVAGSFDDCQRLVKQAFANPRLREQVRLSSANSINIGRLLPQMIYYFHAVAQLRRAIGPEAVPVFATPSGNFGNLTGGLMAKRAGLPAARFVAATNANDVVPTYLRTGDFEPRPSIQTIANAMDVGNPSNFERMLWLYDGDIDAMRRDIVGSRHDDAAVKETIRRVHEERGYLLDPHSAIAYMGLRGDRARGGQDGRRPGIFLCTAHPAKFAEIIEPVIGRPVKQPPSLAAALSRRPTILRIPAEREAVADVVSRQAESCKAD